MPILVHKKEGTPFPTGYRRDHHKEPVTNWPPGEERDVSHKVARYLLTTFPEAFAEVPYAELEQRARAQRELEEAAADAKAQAEEAAALAAEEAARAAAAAKAATTPSGTGDPPPQQ